MEMYSENTTEGDWLVRWRDAWKPKDKDLAMGVKRFKYPQWDINFWSSFVIPLR